MKRQMRSDIAGRGLYQISSYEHRFAAASNPHVNGAKVTVAWAELEPDEGAYAWASIDDEACPWRDAGKRVLISVVTADHRPSGPATPRWVFDASAKGVLCRARDGIKELFPVYWEEVCLEKLARLVASLGERYDTMQGVEMVFVGGGQYAEVMPSINLREPMLAQRSTCTSLPSSTRCWGCSSATPATLLSG